MAEPDPAVIKTAGRVFEVLEYFGRVRRAVTVREVSEQLAYPLSSAQVLLKSIATLGYLRYDATLRAYLASPRLATLGDWVMESMFQGGRLPEVLGTLSRETGLTAILAVENDIYAQYVNVVLGGQAIQFNAQPGTRRLICMSGMGWALLAASSDEQVARAIHRTQTRLAPGRQQVDAARVRAHVEATRRLGHAFSKGTVTAGVGIVAMAAPRLEAGARFAIGVGGLISELETGVERLVPRMRELLDQLTTQEVLS